MNRLVSLNNRQPPLKSQSARWRSRGEGPAATISVIQWTSHEIMINTTINEMVWFFSNDNFGRVIVG